MSLPDRLAPIVPNPLEPLCELRVWFVNWLYSSISTDESLWIILISSNSVLSLEFSTLTRSFAALVLDDSVPIPPRVIRLVVVMPDMRIFELATLTKDPGKPDAVETPIFSVPRPMDSVFNPNLSKL